MPKNKRRSVFCENCRWCTNKAFEASIVQGEDYQKIIYEMKVFNFQSTYCVIQDKVYYLDKKIFLRKIVGCGLAIVTMSLIVIYKIHLYNHFCRSIIRKIFCKWAIIRIFNRNYTFMRIY